MARYREKDETDLLWNSVRRRVTRELDTQIMDYRETVLNDLLTMAWDNHAASQQNGNEDVRIQPDYVEWVAQAMKDAKVGHEIRDMFVNDEAG